MMMMDDDGWDGGMEGGMEGCMGGRSPSALLCLPRMYGRRCTELRCAFAVDVDTHCCMTNDNVNQCCFLLSWFVAIAARLACDLKLLSNLHVGRYDVPCYLYLLLHLPPRRRTLLHLMVLVLVFI